MILPGLSGALMLLLLGAYHFLLVSISSLNLLVLGSVALGGVLGLIICGRLIKHLLVNNEAILYAISLGLVIGSIPVVLSEGIPSNTMTIFSSSVFAFIGFITVLILNLKRV
jgi:putative membrane protein